MKTTPNCTGRARLSLRRAMLAGAVALLVTNAWARDALEGQVLDEETGQPIAGAIVVVQWRAGGGGVAGATAFCLHVETATTDAQGKYRVEDWNDWWNLKHGLLWDRRRAFQAYKLWYKPSPKTFPTQEKIYLHPFKGTTQEWFDAGLARGFECSTGLDESRKNLYRLYAAIAADAARIAETPEQRAYVDGEQREADDYLIDYAKPVVDELGRRKNANPEDSYKKEDLLK